MAKASSQDILGLGRPLGSGPGAIRQFWNPIKPARAPAAAWQKPAPTTVWAWGGQGAVRQFWNASRSMAKASSKYILGLGKPLGSGPEAFRQFWNILGLGRPLGSGAGAIRQFWNRIKPARAPAAAWLKPAPKCLQRHFGLGEAFGIGTGGHPSVLKPDKTSQGASRSMAKASSKYILGYFGLGEAFGIGTGGHPSVLKPDKTSQGASRSMAKAKSNYILGLMLDLSCRAVSRVLRCSGPCFKSEAMVPLTAALRESNVPHLRWSQAPPCLGQGEAGSADYIKHMFFCSGDSSWCTTNR